MWLRQFICCMIAFRLTLLCISFWLCHYTAFSQERDSSTLNQFDEKGKRHGLWLIAKPGKMGERRVTELGHYEHGRRYGTWYTMDHVGEMVAVEIYRNGVLDGEAKYFENGQLYCVGNYRGLGPVSSIDTIIVVDPETYEEDYKGITSMSGTMRHGIWRYYDPESGILIREEEYVSDDLIYKQVFYNQSAIDSIKRQRHLEKLPHNQKTRYRPPDKKLSGHVVH